MNLYTLRYNNYYNRTLKRFDDLVGYEPYFLETFTAMQFNPNDGITTTIILNITADNIPDYILVSNGLGKIDSRWYVAEAVRTRNGQYQLSLMRDVLADFWNEIAASPMKIHRGYLNNNDRLIFNPENYSVSQIKKSEHLLKDNTNAAWIVGYLANPTEIIGEEKEPEEGLTIKYGRTQATDYLTVESFDSWDYRDSAYIDSGTAADFHYYATIEDYSMYVSILGKNYKITFDKYGFVERKQVFNVDSGLFALQQVYGLPKNPASLAFLEESLDAEAQADEISEVISAANTAYSITIDKNHYQQIQNLNGQQIKFADTGLIYNITVENAKENDKDPALFRSNDNGLVMTAFEGLRTAINDYAYNNVPDNDISDDNMFLFRYDSTSKVAYSVNFGSSYGTRIKLVPVSMVGAYHHIIPPTVRSLEDAPYRMFCIPYSNNFRIKHDGLTYSASRSNALTLATGIALSGGSRVYDVQLLPYCPIQQIRDGTAAQVNLDTYGGVEHTDWEWFANAELPVFFCRTSRGTFNIAHAQDGPTENPIDTKAKVITEFSRLCSPNYQGVFEYSPIKNYGVSEFNVDYEYKPINPYIHINPNFYVGGMYGSDFNDARGLICGGDFSLTRISSAWTEYQLNNKNYNEIFARNIDTMEDTEYYNRIQRMATAGVGVIQGTVSGATGGFMAGGPWGAVAGGVIGAAGSVGGGIADLYVADKLYGINKSHTEDMHALQLGNIKAQPMSLTKTSAFNNNNKIWPFIETYGTTNNEYRAVYDAICYNGMSVNVIGTLSEYVPKIPAVLKKGFFQATPIFLEGIADDAHVCDAIAKELIQGVYITK